MGEEERVMFVHQMTFPDSAARVINNLNVKTFSMNDTLDVLRQNGIKTNYWKATNQYDHWNHYAHRAVGMYLSKRLCKELEAIQVASNSVINNNGD